MERAQAVLFDLDGTLWNAVEEICYTWNEVVKKNPDSRETPISIEEMGECLGLPMTKIAEKLFPKASKERQLELLEECSSVENEYLRTHGAKLYPKLRETLLELKKDYKLFVVSNCQQGYIESFIEAHGLSDCFDDIECWGNNQLPKGENNKLIMKRNNVERAVYVGDTAGDEESARAAKIPFVFAAYGFGKAKAPDYILKEFAQLPELMKTVSF